MYLLDTNVLSDFRKPRSYPDLLAWAEVYLGGGMVLSVHTVTEIVAGATWIGRRAPDRELEILAWLRNITNSPDTTVLQSTIAECVILGKMGGVDVRIAAAAIAYGCTLVSRNISDMLRINDHFRLPGLIDPYTNTEHVGPIGTPHQLSFALSPPCLRG
jgi:predicted nucleic acid-binding protein